ncbi:MAG: transporter [Candidatus Aminicenantes bacterium]|nr:transporter [Candidatus Aminicenantes bacterium]MDH5742698.1 transporter [Candidatus Aminicenantes bacterium]
MNYGWLSLIPPLLAIVLAFITREPVISLAVACVVGVLIMGQGLVGFPELLVKTLGSKDFMWVCLIEICIGILVAFYQRCGAVDMFGRRVSHLTRSRSQTQFLGWGLGLFIFFSDYFSPLFTGPVMRNLTDKARISREKLAYICDSTSAPVSVLAPITGWAVYISALLVGIGPVLDKKEAMSLFIKSIPFNFYAILSVLMVALISWRIIPEFGPMRKAEQRAIIKGQVIRPGSVPMMSSELTDLAVSDKGRPNIWLNFFMPVLIVIAVNIGTFIATGQARVLESFMLATGVLGVVLFLQRVDSLQGLMRSVSAGIKGVMPAVLILGFAYAINTVSREMGTAPYVIEVSKGWLNPDILPLLVFFISAFVSFATGTSWGTFAIIIPVSVPLAFEFSGGQVSSLVLATVAASAGGGVFGDHCSPLSDTTVLSSLGSACDHMDHVRTQLPYALVAAAATALIYLALGLF